MVLAIVGIGGSLFSFQSLGFIFLLIYIIKQIELSVYSPPTCMYVNISNYIFCLSLKIILFHAWLKGLMAKMSLHTLYFYFCSYSYDLKNPTALCLMSYSIHCSGLYIYLHIHLISHT